MITMSKVFFTFKYYKKVLLLDGSVTILVVEVEITP